MSKLANAKHEAFCQQFLVDLNATAAYRRVYPKATAKSARTAGARLLTIVGITERVAMLQAKRADRVEVTQDYVLTRLRENVERAMQVEAVRDREGNETGEYVYAGAVANGALTLLGKHLGMFTEKVEHTGKDGTPLPVPQVNVYVPDNGRGAGHLAPARLRVPSNGNGR